MPFLVNDNVEIAREMNADGVHVGQSDMEAQDVRAILGPDKILGVSAQTVEQAVLAEKHGADYLGVGAVFPTGSKDDADDVSYETLKAICGPCPSPLLPSAASRRKMSRSSRAAASAVSRSSARFTRQRTSNRHPPT